MRRLSFRVDRRYLSKKECLSRAREILDSDLIDMDEKELAREIYFHARMYYWFRGLKDLPGFRYIVDKSDPIDLRDGGDTTFRRILFRIMWPF